MVFFREHGCHAKEAHAKYSSRAASLYRDQISSLARDAMSKYETQVQMYVNAEVEITAGHRTFSENV